MKVLFAVSSESISDAIIKKYQKEYKEILSYKNVYYFNAILKEIQKDKTYDRIVISEDLEPFSNNNYEAIDKFIFEKLDNISDEAQDIDGNETSIILICTDRHTKGSSFLVKLFGIGIYNALLGNDRSMEQVCKLINKPRVKKEAKSYYKIDSDDVNYSNKNEKEVSELEIQNILTHFKKLGKNTDKFADSFNSIASQYTDEQLKIIINCLPINVKAVLEEDCPKYQEIMSVNGMMQRVNKESIKTKEAQKQTGIKIDIIENKMNQAKMSGPIVIPASVRTSKNKGPAPVRPMGNNIEIKSENKDASKAKKVVKRVEEPKQIESTRPVRNQQNEAKIGARRENIVNKQQPDSLRKPKASSLNDIVAGVNITNEDRKDIAPKMRVSNEENEEIVASMEEKKKGRGRPRKEPSADVQVKPKGKRGRPKKQLEEVVEEDNDEVILPGMDTDFEEEVMLPGMDDFDDIENDDGMLPGLDDFEDADDENDGMLPGLDDFEDADDEDDGMLPGLDDFEDADDEDMLPGMDDDYEEVEEDEDTLPEMDDYEEVEDDEDALPEMDDYEEIEEDEDTLPEMDDYEEVEDDEYTDEVDLPGLDELDELDDFSNDDDFEEIVEDDEDDLLPNIEVDDDLEDGLLTDFDNDEEDVIEESQSNYESQSQELESIKPQVDYSMSNLNSLLTKDKKIVTFLGTTKNGTSFLVNNLAALFSSCGISTAILDMTKNKNSYYIYTNNEEELRNIAYNSISKLQKGFAEGIKVNKNLSVYTALPNDGKDYTDAEPILSTLVQNHSLILIDCDFDTDPSYFASCQEIYLVQSMDILTIQPLTAFLRDLKAKGVLESEKVRVVINKEIKVRSLSEKAIIGGMSFYNDPSMSFMTELFNKDMVKACSIPFEDNAYSKYLDSMVNCNVSLNGYSKSFLNKLKNLGDMVYPLVSKSNYGKVAPQGGQNFGKSAFSKNMNNTLNQMKNKY